MALYLLIFIIVIILVLATKYYLSWEGKTYRSRYVIKNISRLIRVHFVNSIQRIKKGYGFADIWGLDYYLANILVNSLSELKRVKTGIPYPFTEKQWDKILDSIIYTFEVAKKIGDCDFVYISSDNKDFKKLYRKYKKDGYRLGITSHVMTKRESKKYEKGWQLFQKNFFNIAD